MATSTLAYNFAKEIETEIFGQILACLENNPHCSFRCSSERPSVQRVSSIFLVIAGMNIFF
jgi:hypothetical protein